MASRAIVWFDELNSRPDLEKCINTYISNGGACLSSINPAHLAGRYTFSPALTSRFQVHRLPASLSAQDLYFLQQAGCPAFQGFTQDQLHFLAPILSLAMSITPLISLRLFSQEKAPDIFQKLTQADQETCSELPAQPFTFFHHSSAPIPPKKPPRCQHLVNSNPLLRTSPFYFPN